MTNTRKPTKTDFQVGRVFLISLCHLIHDVYTSFLAPLLPFLIEKFSMSLAQAGLLTTVMQLPSLLNPLIGKLADRISVRYFIIIAPMLTAIPMSLLGLAPHYGVLLLLVFFTGISVSLFHVPAPVLVYKVAGTKTGLGMSWYMTGGELARTVGPMIIVATVALLGFDHYYPIMLVGIGASLLMLKNFRDMPVTINSKASSSIRQTIKTMQSVLMPISAILVIRGFMHACLTAFLPLYVLQHTNNVWLSGISLSLFEGAGVVGIMLVGGLSDRIGRISMLLFCLITAPLSLLAFTLVDGWLTYAALLLTGFSLLSTTPVMLAMIQESSGEGSSAANGVFMMISFLARSAVVVLVGYVADHLGLNTTFLLCGLIGLGGIPMVLWLKWRPQQ
jgi:FSR family fosmidomycin resistance protein-like MFS transporter